MNVFRLAICVFALVLIASAQIALVPSAGGKHATLAPGQWGGEHISMMVTSEGANLEFDCAVGHITVPIVVDGDGRFTVKGIYRHERPAAARVDDNNGIEVEYRGRLEGNTLHLEFATPGEEEPLRFDLVFGDQGRLAKCA